VFCDSSARLFICPLSALHCPPDTSDDRFSLRLDAPRYLGHTLVLVLCGRPRFQKHGFSSFTCFLDPSPSPSLQRRIWARYIFPSSLPKLLRALLPWRVFHGFRSPPPLCRIGELRSNVAFLRRAALAYPFPETEGFPPIGVPSGKVEAHLSFPLPVWANSLFPEFCCWFCPCGTARFPQRSLSILMVWFLHSSLAPCRCRHFFFHRSRLIS